MKLAFSRSSPSGSFRASTFFNACCKEMLQMWARQLVEGQGGCAEGMLGHLMAAVLVAALSVVTAMQRPVSPQSRTTASST
ncbi:hypothetical protein CLOP_g11561 [Closterium sp. NIES-67]|nr:hypothetical protein CLOP_g11561 [Closterium sp. NIES-67]